MPSRNIDIDQEAFARLTQLASVMGPALDGLLEAFVPRAQAYIEAIGKGTLDEAHEAAHKLYGSGGQLGFRVLSEAARRAERSLEKGNHKTARTELPALKDAYAAMCRTIEARHRSRLN